MTRKKDKPAAKVLPVPDDPQPDGRFPPPRKTRTRRVWLNVLPDDLWLRVERGTTIYEALRDADVDIDGDCGGMGKCGKCKVRVLTSIGFPPKKSRKNLTDEELRQGVRLACRTRIHKDTSVHVGEHDPELEYVQILKTGELPVLQLDPLVGRKLVNLTAEPGAGDLSDMERIRLMMGPDHQSVKPALTSLRALPRLAHRASYQGAAVIHEKTLMDWQEWEELGNWFGLVLDLGTSTLVGKLINLLDGSEVAAVSRLNSQMKYGADVISRIRFVREESDGLERLRSMLIRDVNRIIRRLREVAEIHPYDVYAATAAGNTTMQHLLLGVDPSAIAEAPFTPVVTEGLVIKGADLALDLHPEAPLYLLPARSGYIGGDMLAVILASGAAEQDDEIVLGLDLGTNGEIFLGNRQRMLTCSAAAGPALEGGNISHGMIAMAGAVEGVQLGDDDLVLRIVGNIKPRGLCGSGLVDLVAVLLHCGIVDPEGLITRGPDGIPPALARRVTPAGDVCHFMVGTPEESHHGRPVYLTQKDVRELQLAKGAIAAGVRALMDEMGVEAGDIGRVMLTGALGNYVNTYSAMRVGLLPQVEASRVTLLGNGASVGASMALLARSHWNRVRELAGFVEHLELSARADFNTAFVEQLDFPAENTW